MKALEEQLVRIGKEEPVLTSAEVGTFTVVTETHYQDIRAELDAVAALTPSSSELVVIAERNPAPDDWWDEES